MGKTINGIAIFLSGASIGWLLGLSESPVIAATISTILAAVIALVTIAPKGESDGGKSDNKYRLDDASVLPLAILVVSMAISAPLGIMARNGQWFTPVSPLEQMVNEWKKYGKDEKLVAGDIYNSWLKHGKLPDTPKVDPGIVKGGLFSGGSASFCDAIAPLVERDEVNADELINEAITYNQEFLIEVFNLVPKKSVVRLAAQYCQ